MPVKTIRGVWRIREYRSGDSGPLCKGRIKMKGFVEEPNKGTLEYYDGCDGGCVVWLVSFDQPTGTGIAWRTVSTDRQSAGSPNQMYMHAPHHAARVEATGC